jgi:UDP-glucuronate 4-epimerase
MKVLVTGAAGFIGSHVVDRLLADGCDVIGFDNFDPFYSIQTKRNNLSNAVQSPRFHLVEGDLRDANLVREIVFKHEPEGVIHLAAKAGVRPSIENPSAYIAVNVLGTAHLLDAVVQLTRRPRLVYASSSSVYGDRSDVPFRETDRCDQPVSPYAATKIACELLAHTYHLNHGLSLTGLRFFTAYGPRNRPDLAIAKFAELIENDQMLPMFGDGSTRRDYTYVIDIVDGVVRALNACDGERIYNLGHHHPIALSDMIRQLGQALGREPRIQQLPEQPGDVRQTYADISRARTELGWAPRTEFMDGLREYVAWRRHKPA